TDTYQIETKMTRTTDVSLGKNEKEDLKARTDMANKWKADLFLSIHANSFNKTENGYEDYIYPGLENSTTGEMQDVIHKEIKPVLSKHNIKDRGKKTADFHVLRETNMAAILIEVAFLDNSND